MKQIIRHSKCTQLKVHCKCSQIKVLLNMNELWFMLSLLQTLLRDIFSKHLLWVIVFFHLEKY